MFSSHEIETNIIRITQALDCRAPWLIEKLRAVPADQLPEVYAAATAGRLIVQGNELRNVEWSATTNFPRQLAALGRICITHAATFDDEQPPPEPEPRTAGYRPQLFDIETLRRIYPGFDDWPTVNQLVALIGKTGEPETIFTALIEILPSHRTLWLDCIAHNRRCLLRMLQPDELHAAASNDETAFDDCPIHQRPFPCPECRDS